MKMSIETDPYAAREGDAGWNKKGMWPCRWVACGQAGEPPFVCAYRLRFDMEASATVRVHVTACERYELWLDGARVGRGSERGDAARWFFETHDLDLAAGAHVLVARVWTLGEKAPFAQMPAASGFLLSPEAEEYWDVLGTGRATWEAKPLPGIQFLDPIAAWGTGANVIVDGAQTAWGWERGEGEGWAAVQVGEWGSTVRRNDRPVTPLLEPGGLPAMRETDWPAGTVRYISALPTASREELIALNGKPTRFTCGLPLQEKDNLPSEQAEWNRLLRSEANLTLPPHTCRRVLIDLEDYVCAYPEIVTSGGAGSVVRVHWQEGLFNESNTKTKGNRDEIEGKYFITIWHVCDGIGDAFLPDGGADRRFDTLWWQCGRYVEVVIQTEAEPLTLSRLAFRETRYPLEMEARFACSDPRLADVAPLMRRALQMCSHETYMDCPYYEQLQYVGDTRLQALTTFAITRDTRLARKAVRAFDWSRQLDGLTQSRYPTRVFQSIPPFSLWWVLMLHDYARWRDDAAGVKDLLPGARGVVERFARQVDAEGRLWAVEGWNCFDWVPEWKDGTPPGGHEGVSGPLSWQFVLAARALAELETHFGEPELASRARNLAGRVAAGTMEALWNEARGLLADDTAQAHYSEHTQCLALLSGHLEPARAARIADGLFNAPDLSRTTIYFSHYLFEACHLLGRTDKIIERMALWFDLKAQGLKTTVEMPEPTRSDCHAWGAHPLYHYFASLLGIRPASMGFRSVRIAPDLGPLSHARGVLPHPLGDIEVDLRRENNGLTGFITLPDGLKGSFEQAGRLLPLRAGRTEVSA